MVSDIDTVPEARGVEAISAGSIYLVKDDYEALERGFTMYYALHVYVQLEKIQKKYREELVKMERGQLFGFTKSHVKEPPEAKVKRPSR